MPRKSSDDEVKRRLRQLTPDVVKITCYDDSSSNNTVSYVRPDRVRYFTTDFDRDGYKLMLETVEGKRYFLNLELEEIQGILEPYYPHFFRSGKLNLINLEQIAESRVNRARDIRFEDSDEWILNLVSRNAKITDENPDAPQYLDDFQARFVTRV